MASEYARVDLVRDHCGWCGRDTEQELAVTDVQSGMFHALYLTDSRCLHCGETWWKVWFDDEYAALVCGYVPAAA